MTSRTETVPRSRAPVFVVGCPRSGTTLLYHMLLSAGDFAVYRAESNVFNLLVPRFGDLSIRRNRQSLTKAWLRTKMFAVSGLDAGLIEAKILHECKSGADFLRIFMGEIAHNQGVDRWADCTPEHLLYLQAIKESLPEALFIHIIRDGRDVALSIDKQGWVRRFSWDNGPSPMAAALYWRWMVRKGRESGRMVTNYMEVRYEQLIAEPRRTLVNISRFIDHDLDYDRILQVGIGSVSQPNTSFEFEGRKAEFSPVGRWKKLLSPEDLADMERLIGDLLGELGYPLTVPSGGAHHRRNLKLMRFLYQLNFDVKQWVKTRTRLSEFWRRNDDRLELQAGPERLKGGL